MAVIIVLGIVSIALIMLGIIITSALWLVIPGIVLLLAAFLSVSFVSRAG